MTKFRAKNSVQSAKTLFEEKVNFNENAYQAPGKK